MEIEIRKMETDAEFRGKAHVHWATWHAAYTGLIDQSYLNKFTPEKCEEIAYRWPDNILIAKDGERVLGFVGYDDGGEDAPDTGEIFALYVLPEYWGTGVGQRLFNAGTERLKAYRKLALWVLKGNARAIRFYEKCGFGATGEEQYLPSVGATEIRMERAVRKTYAFTAILHEEPDGGAYVIFPWDTRKEFKKGRVKVHATFDGVPYDGSIVNMGVKDADGNVCYIIGVRNDIRKQLGKKHGDTIRVTITEREADK